MNRVKFKYIKFLLNLYWNSNLFDIASRWQWRTKTLTRRAGARQRRARAQYGRVTLKLEGQSKYFISVILITCWLSNSFCGCVVNIGLNHVFKSASYLWSVSVLRISCSTETNTNKNAMVLPCFCRITLVKHWYSLFHKYYTLTKKRQYHCTVIGVFASVIFQYYSMH